MCTHLCFLQVVLPSQTSCIWDRSRDCLTLITHNRPNPHTSQRSKKGSTSRKIQLRTHHVLTLHGYAWRTRAARHFAALRCCGRSRVTPASTTEQILLAADDPDICPLIARAFVVRSLDSTLKTVARGLPWKSHLILIFKPGTGGLVARCCH